MNSSNKLKLKRVAHVLLIVVGVWLFYSGIAAELALPAGSGVRTSLLFGGVGAVLFAIGVRMGADLARDDAKQVSRGNMGPAPVGVRGWLLFLVIVLFFVVPARNFQQILALLNQVSGVYAGRVSDAALTNYRTFGWIIIVASSVFSMYAGWQLYRTQVARSVWWATAAVWISGPITVLFFLADSVVFLGIDEHYYVNTGTALLLLPVVYFAALWTGYLKLSTRVANTYYRVP
jgi:hypothetical protein